jgi:hypothetical protein
VDPWSSHQPLGQEGPIQRAWVAYRPEVHA